jgi:PKD repeat protein
MVTPQVQAALAGDGQLSLELFSLSDVGGPGLVSYASREDATPARRPQLLLVYASAADTLAASFYATPTNGGAPLTVTFTDSSTGVLTNRFWSFGDGVTTNTTTTSLLHTYQFPGTNTVRLIVSGASGLSTNTQTNLIVATSVDTVGDGIPDWWRALYFGGSGTTTDATSCATCDLTGTGQNNLFKYVADLNPTDPASRLAIISISTSNDDVHLIWVGGTSAWQYLESSPTLVSNQWSASSTNPPPTAITNSVIHTGATTATNLFYRIKANR